MAIAPPVVRSPPPTRRAVLPALTALAALGASAALVGCAGRHAADAPAAPPPGSTVDASYDWRGQVTVPFGALLKSVSVPLHEVLLFHDESTGVATPGAAAPGAADAQSQDCYAMDGAPPRLVGQTPDAYLLCFDHDRLNRIESSVHLPPETAAQVFARACAAWLADALPANTPAGVCEGRVGTTTFTWHLLSELDAPATLSLVLLNADPVP